MKKVIYKFRIPITLLILGFILMAVLYFRAAEKSPRNIATVSVASKFNPSEKRNLI